MTTVSVVIPTFNRIQRLPRALESVLAQARAAEEVIVVDDGSTDGTSDWIAVHFPQVRVLRQENRGVSAARNRGIEAATSDWIAFLDSDDAWMPSKLERQIGCVANEAEAVLCHTDETWIRRGQPLAPLKKHEKSGGWIYERCLALCCISPSAALVRRSLLLELGGFDESLPACEDYDLWLRICSRHPVHYIEEKLVTKYGGHTDQLSSRHWGMDRFRVRALESILGETHLTPLQRAQTLRMLVTKLGILETGATKRGKAGEAEGYRARKKAAERELASLAPV